MLFGYSLCGASCDELGVLADVMPQLCSSALVRSSAYNITVTGRISVIR